MHTRTYIHYITLHYITYVHTYIRTYRRTDGQTDRQTDRHTYIIIYIYICNIIYIDLDMCVRIKRSHSDGRLKNHHPMGGLGSIGKEITFHTGPLDLMGTGAGDRNPLP